MWSAILGYKTKHVNDQKKTNSTIFKIKINNLEGRNSQTIDKTSAGQETLSAVCQWHTSLLTMTATKDLPWEAPFEFIHLKKKLVFCYTRQTEN
jgi:hypothetical protein